MKSYAKVVLAVVLGLVTVALGWDSRHDQASAATAAAVDWPSIFLIEVTNNLNRPVHITHANDGSGRLFIVEQPGRIRLYKNGMLLSTPFLDISGIVRSTGNEEGLFSVAFPPGYGSSKDHFYVYYVNQPGDLVIARYGLTSDPDVADDGSEEIVLTINHPGQSNHNGGQLAFGPNDGYLYIAPGDGGGSGDPPNNAQSADRLLGKMLRIDVETGSPLTYTIPASNPYTQSVGYRGEIWALGLRNPWRFSFDRQTGDLYIGDVGQGAWEEINFQPAASSGGENYGWRCYEGNATFDTDGCGPMNSYTFPVHQYANDASTCAVAGGHVYRGAVYFRMQGVYLFGDNCGGQIWGLKYDSGAWQSNLLLDTSHNISTFGEDQAGNLYMAHHHQSSGTVYLIADTAALTERVYLSFVSR